MLDPAPLPSPPPLASLIERGPVALFLDFDGTLVDIAHEPGAIHVPRDLVDRLHRLRDRLGGRLALVSGRAIDDLEGHLREIAICRAGSHGASRLLADGARLGEEPPGLPPDLVGDLRNFAAAHGLLYETKRHGGALHFRSRPRHREASLAFAQELADRHGLCMIAGKGIAEIVHPGAEKSGAVEAFMQESPFADALPVFVGDDLTDEDGFAGAKEFGGFGITVGDRPSANADYRIDSVAAVHRWLGL